MYPIVANAYDQNPARITAIVRKYRKGARKNPTFLFSALVTLAAGLAVAFNHFLAKV